MARQLTWVDGHTWGPGRRQEAVTMIQRRRNKTANPLPLTCICSICWPVARSLERYALRCSNSRRVCATSAATARAPSRSKGRVGLPAARLKLARLPSSSSCGVGGRGWEVGYMPKSPARKSHHQEKAHPS